MVHEVVGVFGRDEEEVGGKLAELSRAGFIGRGDGDGEVEAAGGGELEGEVPFDFLGSTAGKEGADRVIGSEAVAGAEGGVGGKLSD